MKYAKMTMIVCCGIFLHDAICATVRKGFHMLVDATRNKMDILEHPRNYVSYSELKPSTVKRDYPRKIGFGSGE